MTVPISLEGRTENVSASFMISSTHSHPNSYIMEEEIITLTMSVWNVFRKSEEQERIRCLLASRQGAISTLIGLCLASELMFVAFGHYRTVTIIKHKNTVALKIKAILCIEFLMLEMKREIQTSDNTKHENQLPALGGVSVSTVNQNIELTPLTIKILEGIEVTLKKGM